MDVGQVGMVFPVPWYTGKVKVYNRSKRFSGLISPSGEETFQFQKKEEVARNELLFGYFNSLLLLTNSQQWGTHVAEIFLYSLKCYEFLIVRYQPFMLYHVLYT